MIFENTEVWGFEHAIRGMRNPKHSHNKSDSYNGCRHGSNNSQTVTKCDDCLYWEECYGWQSLYIIGENDLKLMQTLIRAGSEHRKFLRQIFVSVDITAPMYYWSEFDTYKVGTTANSTSKMHKLSSTPITLECFEIDDINKRCADINAYKNPICIVNYCEELRQKYIQTNDKSYWKELLRWLPESWLQTRTVTMNYENILSMYRQRKTHKLNEWSGIDNPELPNFVGWVKSLPYANELILIE